MPMLAPARISKAQVHTSENPKKIKKSRTPKSDHKKNPLQERDRRMRNINRLQVGMAITRCILYAGLVVAVVAGAIKTLFF